MLIYNLMKLTFLLWQTIHQQPPDLVERLKQGLPLTELNPATLYGGGAEGYTDYPSYQLNQNNQRSGT